MSIRKERVDVLLVERGIYETREKAKAAVMAGLVQVAGERCDKPGTKFPEDVAITVKGEVHPYVGRGGLKLEKALRVFGIDMTGRVMMDIGASTGGFTDCALQHGARLVYAIDVGYGQLAWSLRQDERVVVMERTNFRHLDPETFDHEMPDSASIDVSFISLRLILPVLHRFLKDGGEVVALVKPQFEAGKEKVGKNGIVRDPETHEAVLTDIGEFARGLGFALKGLDFSPITGGEGNIEFVMHAAKGGAGLDSEEWLKRVTEVVTSAHAVLK
ncbi:TlyA family RNA methyltransferase [Brevibacillus nitrificans]|uniref:TlyA family RNA methyltransferase n=1 Tax=Brevibacillus nitrificans TaxID=651560 RepID=UPI0028551AE4|nr:TlyA family RNA methyltransferase [Brevibacillus nitrificans]MDR7314095.1 23S rRNA (cytidine1920-2'-O)/16S rRNA (cytidine1409-2'-O)-methyltransferase [Brevibacillus nitrificans]